MLCSFFVDRLCKFLLESTEWINATLSTIYLIFIGLKMSDQMPSYRPTDICILISDLLYLILSKSSTFSFLNSSTISNGLVLLTAITVTSRGSRPTRFTSFFYMFLYFIIAFDQHIQFLLSVILINLYALIYDLVFLDRCSIKNNEIIPTNSLIGIICNDRIIIFLDQNIDWTEIRISLICTINSFLMSSFSQSKNVSFGIHCLKHYVLSNFFWIKITVILRSSIDRKALFVPPSHRLLLLVSRTVNCSFALLSPFVRYFTGTW